MSAYVYITLDTTPPAIRLFAPAWTPEGAMLPVTLISDEPLDKGRQVVKIIGPDGEEQSIVLMPNEDGTEWVGIMDTWGWPLGVYRIVATMWDEVWNQATTELGISVRERGHLTVEVRVQHRQPRVEYKTRKLKIGVNKYGHASGRTW